MGGESLEFNAQEMAERARTASDTQLENLLYHRSRDVLEALLENPHIGEQQLAVLLARRDLPREVVARIAKNKEWMRSYTLKVSEGLRHLIAEVGASQIVLGTDFPYEMGNTDGVNHILGVPGLSDADREAILGGNHARLHDHRPRQRRRVGRAQVSPLLGQGGGTGMPGFHTPGGIPGRSATI